MKSREIDSYRSSIRLPSLLNMFVSMYMNVQGRFPMRGALITLLQLQSQGDQLLHD